jgi:hypothetical protein
MKLSIGINLTVALLIILSPQDIKQVFDLN